MFSANGAETIIYDMQKEKKKKMTTSLYSLNHMKKLTQNGT